MGVQQDPKVSWKNVPARTDTAGDVTFAYRELGTEHPDPPVVCLIHLAAVLDNWDPRVIDGLATKYRVVTFDNRGVGASTGSPAVSMEQMARDAIAFIKAMGLRSGRSLRILDGRHGGTGDRPEGAATRAPDDHLRDRASQRRRHQQAARGDLHRHVARLAHLPGSEAVSVLHEDAQRHSSGQGGLARLNGRAENRDKRSGWPRSRHN